MYRNFSATKIFQKLAKQYCTVGPENRIREKIGFIGDGNMAKAICRSIQQKGLIDYSQVYVSSPYIKNLTIWQNWGANVTTDNNKVLQNSDIVFLAVKPHILTELIENLRETSGSKLFVSILAGFTLQNLENKLAKFKNSRIVRVMPNTPMLVGAGCTVFCPGKTATLKDLELVGTILEVTGLSQQVPENIVDAVGAVSGSGPAFVYLFIEALSDGGVKMGLHRDMATKIAAQTVFGAAKMVLETGKHMGVLKDEVCSAGGTTITGMHALEKGAVRGAVMDAVEAAAQRAQDLGKK